MFQPNRRRRSSRVGHNPGLSVYRPTADALAALGITDAGPGEANPTPDDPPGSDVLAVYEDGAGTVKVVRDPVYAVGGIMRQKCGGGHRVLRPKKSD